MLVFSQKDATGMFLKSSLKSVDTLWKGMYSMRMKRVDYHLSEKQLEFLRLYSKESGLSVAELIRRAIDLWMIKVKRETNRVI